MNYKVTPLKHEVKCEEALYKDIPDLLFGTLPNTKNVFDFTGYCEANGIEGQTEAMFMTQCRRYIEYLVRSDNLDVSAMFFVNTNGHMLVAEELAVVFLMFISQEGFLYLTQIIVNVLQNGIAFSDTFITMMASMRIPTQVLQEIIENRANEEQ